VLGGRDCDVSALDTEARPVFGDYIGMWMAEAFGALPEA
jgi:hypothetical protein